MNDKIQLIELPQNIGGFYEGMKGAKKTNLTGYGLWMMMLFQCLCAWKNY